MKKFFRASCLILLGLTSHNGAASTASCGLDGDYQVQIYRYCTGGLCSGESIIMTIENDAIKGQFGLETITPQRGVGPTIDGVFEIFLREGFECEFYGTRERAYARSLPGGGVRHYVLKDKFQIVKEISGYRFSQSAEGEAYREGRFYPAWRAAGKEMKHSDVGLGTPNPVEP